ncbi:MAG: phosphomannomutase/phosphoglucomutase [Gammaproteobacteria bacterium]
MVTNKIANCPKEIFRAYDIRGIVDENLTTDIAYTIGLALGTRAHQQQIENFIVARDGRISSPMLAQALIQGLTDAGMHVIDIGAVPSGVLYFACYYLNIGAGVMVTGSHNPKNYNGFKILLDFMALTEQAIQYIYQMTVAQTFHYGKGQVISQNVTQAYIGTIVERVKPKRKLKIVIDCGNGIAGEIAPTLYEQLGCDVTALYCEVDGNFPNHHPNPSVVDNLQDLIEAVKKQNADIGLAFDGDADRLGVVTATGEVIWPDRQMILFSQDVLSRNPGAKILFDVKCTRHLADAIQNAGGNGQMVRTGHSFVKTALKTTGALLAGEMSGHIFFKENWYGFDDGLYCGARLIELLSRQEDLAKVWQNLPNSINTPEINITVPEQEKFLIMEKLLNLADFPDAKIITIDGLRVEFAKGWGLIRASNTTPCLVMRFEAIDETSLQEIQDKFTQLLDQAMALGA